MDVLKKLNEPESNKSYYGLPKLALGYHRIVFIRESQGKYGRSVIVELDHEIIFLPSFMAGKLDENDIKSLNTMKEKLYLYFGGRHKKKQFLDPQNCE